MRTQLFPVLLLASSMVAACSSEQTSVGDPPATPATTSPAAGTDPGTTDPGTEDPGTEDPGTPPVKAQAISFPQAKSSGGRVIKAPRILPILFKGDPLAAQITTFHQKLAPSNYWKSIATEYGIGSITAAAPVTIDETPPSSMLDSDIQAWLQAKMGGALGEADENTLYAIYYPKGVSIDLDGSQSCQAFGGYHSEVNAGGTHVGYAVMPRCGAQHGATDMDVLTLAASHEAFEWATDPLPYTNPAYSEMAPDHLAWALAFLPELGDLCSQADFGFVPAEIGFRVQRMWSNQSAAAGHNPCIPLKTGSYFVGVPMVSDSVKVDAGHSTKGVSVKKGESVTIPVQFYSDDPNEGEFNLRVVDSSEFGGGASGAGNSGGGLTYSLDKDTGKPGDVVTLTVTASKTASYSLFYVVASKGQRYSLWPAIAIATK